MDDKKEEKTDTPKTVVKEAPKAKAKVNVLDGLKELLADCVEKREKNKKDGKKQDRKLAFTIGILEGAILDVKGLDQKLQLHGY